MIVGLTTLAACTPELPECVRASDVPATARAVAISLDRALEQKMLEVKPITTHSSRTEMALMLKPTVTSQPWIRIDPGWVAQNPRPNQAAFVTTQTVYVRMPKREKFKVYVRHVRLRPTRATGIPTDLNLVQFDHPKLVEFLRITGDEATDPPWKLVQIGVWAIVDDVSYEFVRPPTKGKHFGYRGNHEFATPGQIEQVMELLAKADHDRGEFALWHGVFDEMEKHVNDYEDDRDTDIVRAFTPFKNVCNFYPLELAGDVMIGALDRHDDAQGRAYRTYIVDVLIEHGTSREIEVLRRRSNFESNEKILAAMRQAILKFDAEAAVPGR